MNELKPEILQIYKDVEYICGTAARRLISNSPINNGYIGMLLFEHDDIKNKFILKYSNENTDSCYIRCDDGILYIGSLHREMQHMSKKCDVYQLVASWVDDAFEYRMYNYASKTLRRLTEEEFDNFSNKRAKVLDSSAERELSIDEPGWSAILE